jgi:hypothetical protein
MSSSGTYKSSWRIQVLGHKVLGKYSLGVQYELGVCHHMLTVC